MLQKLITHPIHIIDQDGELSPTALNKPFMEVDGIGQLSRFHRIIKRRQR